MKLILSENYVYIGVSCKMRFIFNTHFFCNLNSYTWLEQKLHQIALSSQFMREVTFDFENTNMSTLNELDNHIFITGLARAGTTILLNALYKSNIFASLSYADMPFVLAPNLWSKISFKEKDLELKERAHGDGIKVSTESPEAFEEVFWKTFAEEEYGELEDKFRVYVGNIVKKYKKDKNAKPVILMGYYNMIFQYGDDNFLNKCKTSGVNGLIVVDLPWPENKDFAKKCKKKSIYFIQLLSPTTTSKRLKKIIQNSHPMNYFISMLSTTGGKLKVSPREILKNYNRIKKINPKKEIVIGFGITDKTIGKLKSADGLVVGSAICKEITRSLNSRQNPVTNVGKLVSKLKYKIQ